MQPSGTARRCRARRRATGRSLDPMAAFQMVHIMEGVVERGTATVLARPQPAVVRQDRNHVGPDQCLVRRRNAGHRRRRLPRLRPAAPDGRMAHRADASPRRSSSNSPRSRSRTCRRCRSSRRTEFAGCASIARPGAGCSASFPVQEDPKSAVIWEAFQPQTEPRRFRRSHGPGVDGQEDATDPNNPDQIAGAEQRPQVVRAQSRRPRPPQPAEAALQNQRHLQLARVQLTRFRTKAIHHARRSAGPYRPDQCRDSRCCVGSSIGTGR